MDLDGLDCGCCGAGRCTCLRANTPTKDSTAHIKKRKSTGAILQSDGVIELPPSSFIYSPFIRDCHRPYQTIVSSLSHVHDVVVAGDSFATEDRYHLVGSMGSTLQPDDTTLPCMTKTG